MLSTKISKLYYAYQQTWKMYNFFNRTLYFVLRTLYFVLRTLTKDQKKIMVFIVSVILITTFNIISYKAIRLYFILFSYGDLIFRNIETCVNLVLFIAMSLFIFLYIYKLLHLSNRIAMSLLLPNIIFYLKKDCCCHYF